MKPHWIMWSVQLTKVVFAFRFPATDAGYVIGAFAAIVGVLLMNVPMAFILISFDEVYSGRKEREKSVRQRRVCCTTRCCPAHYDIFFR